MMRLSWVRSALLGAGVLGGVLVTTGPAAAQYFGYGYGEGGYRPYYVPYYRPRAVFVPPPVYVAPPLATYPAVAPARPFRRHLARVRPAAPAPVCAAPGESPFAGSGVEGGIVPASVPAPFVAPIPGLPRLRPGAGDLPRDPAPASAAPVPPNAIYPPESASGFRGD